MPGRTRLHRHASMHAAPWSRSRCEGWQVLELLRRTTSSGVDARSGRPRHVLRMATLRSQGYFPAHRIRDILLQFPWSLRRDLVSLQEDKVGWTRQQRCFWRSCTAPMSITVGKQRRRIHAVTLSGARIRTRRFSCQNHGVATQYPWAAAKKKPTWNSCRLPSLMLHCQSPSILPIRRLVVTLLPGSSAFIWFSNGLTAWSKKHCSAKPYRVSASLRKVSRAVVS